MFLRNGRQFVKAFESRAEQGGRNEAPSLSLQEVVVALAGKCLFYKFKEVRCWQRERERERAGNGPMGRSLRPFLHLSEHFIGICLYLSLTILTGEI